MALKFDIVGDNRNFLQALDQSVDGVHRASREIQQSGMGIEDMFKRIAAAAGIAFTLDQAKGFVNQVMTVRGQFQQLEIAFSTMLQSEEKAKELMDQLVETAAKTPFDLKGVSEGAKQLLAYGIQAEEVNETITRLGDIAAGLSIPLGDLVYLYGTTMTQGRMFTMDLRQFMGRGIPMAEELAKQFGVAKEEVAGLVTAGRVSAEAVKNAIWGMTEEGTKFGGLMAKQSASITGQISNIQDAIDNMFNDIGQQNEGLINSGLKGVSYLVEHYEAIGKVLLQLVAIYGSYKAAVIAYVAIQKVHATWIALEQTAHLQNALATEAEIAAKGKATVATVVLDKATKALNATMLANPYVLVAAGIMTLVSAIYLFGNRTDEAAEAQKKLDEATRDLKSEIASERANIDTLFNKLRNAKEGTEEYKKVKDQILGQYGKYLQGLSDEISTLKDVEGAYKAVTKAAREASIARGREAALKDIQDTYGKNYAYSIEKLQNALNSRVGGKQATDALTKIQTELQKTGTISAKTEQQIKEMFRGTADYGNSGAWLTGLKNNEKYLNDYTRLVEQRFKVEDETGKKANESKKKRNKQAIEEERKNLQGQLEALEQSEAIGKKGAELKKKIADLDKELKAYNTTGKSGSSAATDAANRRQKEFELDLKQTEDQAAQSRATRDAIEQARIAAIKNDGEREREAQEEQHRLNLQAISDKEEEMKKALYAYNKSVWENQNRNKSQKYSDTEEGKAGWEAVSLSEDQIKELKALRDKENADYDRSIRDRYKEEARQMREFLKQYGSFEQRKLALAEEYSQRIADARTEGERRSLRKEQAQEEAKLQFESISMGIDWKSLFSGVSNLNKQMMKPIMDQLKAYTQTDEYARANADTQQRIADLIVELRTFLGSDHDATWQNLETAMNDFMTSVDKYNQAVENEKEAVARLTSAKTQLENGEISQEEYDKLKKETEQLGEETANAKDSMGNFARALNNTTDEVEHYTSSLSTFLNNLKGLNGIEGGNELKVAISNFDALKGDLDATLAGMQEGTTKEIGSAISSAIGEGMNFIGNGLTSILGEGIGSIVLIVAQIPKLILQIVGAIKNIITGILDAITELISLRWIDDLINSILDAIGNLIDTILDLPENIAKVIGSVLEGVGGLVEGVLGRVGNIVTLGLLDSNWLSNWLFGDNSAYEAAIDKWGWLLDTWEDNLEYEKSLMEKAYGENAIDIQQYTEGMLKNTMQAAREVYEGWAGSGAGLFSHSNGYDANNDARWDYLIKSNPEIAKKLGVYNVHTNWFDFVAGGDISKLFDLDWKELDKLKHENTQFWQSLYEEARNYLDQYIEAGKAIEEIQNTLNERLTTTTKENVFDDFLKSLYDLADGSEDVFDNIADAWQKMVNKMVINNLVGKQFQQSLEEWYQKLADMQRQRTEGNMDDEWYKDQLESLKNEYKGYVEDAQKQIEDLRSMGIINASGASSSSDYTQEASKRGFASMSQDTGEELNGRFTALQIAGESINNQVILINSQLVSMAELQTGCNSYLSEIRNMMIQGNSFLEDIAKYSKRIYLDFQEKIEDIVKNTKNM